TTGTTGQTLGLQGDYTDPTSDDVWMGARWYNGTDASFRSRDTVFGELTTPISLNRYTYGHASPLNYWDPNGRSVVGLGWRTEWLEDGGGSSTNTSKGGGSSSSAGSSGAAAPAGYQAPEDARDLTGITNFQSQSVAPATTSQAIPSIELVELTLNDSQLDFIAQFLEGHSALPTDWQSGSDLEQYRYFAWTVLANGNQTSLSYDEFKSLRVADWTYQFETSSTQAFEEIVQADCNSAGWPWACENKDALTQGLLLVTGGALTVASLGGGAMLAGATGLELVAGGTSVGVLGGGGFEMIHQGINGGGSIDTQAIQSMMIQGGVLGGLASGAMAWLSRPAVTATNTPGRLPTAETWGRLDTLDDHFLRHGADFGASTADEYAGLASDFFESGIARGLPTRIDPKTGMIRIYDPGANTFGSFNPSGTTATFFKPDPVIHGFPTNWDYWLAQPGGSPWP
ncbi:MAG: hypothetical protein GY788_12290, partial [bacterium]|nr:hypothetical protein [bacterium]